MFVLDATALVALLNSQEDLFELWERADRNELALGIPALAIIEAAGATGASRTAWEPILWPTAIQVLSLSGPVAVEIGAWSGPHAARQALWESRHLGWPIITLSRELYGPDADVLTI